MPDDYIIFLQEHEFNIGAVEDDPINFRQALKSSKSQEWIDAMNEEIKSMRTMTFGILSHCLKV